MNIENVAFDTRILSDDELNQVSGGGILVNDLCFNPQPDLPGIIAALIG